MGRATRRKRLSWWRHIDDKKLGIFGTRAGGTLLVGIVVLLVENPWLIVVLLALVLTGVLFAVAIRRSIRHEVPSLFGPRR